MYVCCVYLLCIYINTHTCMYLFQKNVFCLYIKYIYIWHKLYEYKYIHVDTCKYFKNICCVYLYIQYTDIYYVNKNFYFGCD